MVRIAAAAFGLCMATLPGQADDGAAPADVLRARGLRPDGLFFVLDEDEALAGFRDGDRTVTAFQAASARRAAMLYNDGEIAGAVARIDALRTRNADLGLVIDQLNQINEYRPLRNWNTGHKTAHNAAKNEMNANRGTVLQLQKYLKQLGGQRPGREGRAEIDREFERQHGFFSIAVENLSGVMDPVAREYRELAADGEVSDAIEAINAAEGKRYRLGPSDDFREAYKRLNETRGAFGKSKPASRPGMGTADDDAAEAKARTVFAIAKALEPRNSKAALERYRAIVSDYPGTPEAEEASRRIEALEVNRR
ncbi:hypothetical protein [Tautonia plasticadhaerens]|uniref:Outer membrane protein assembly factor BamD n=1 Tax=Tautonia plasticadhaerens TaxID=2527974 RepID=A0A518H686_9BACT|nr:hypothetical protein [Tautonia plasticadhaerens]QDV36352.1 hypothetical protein ElP_42720 [Tautonia plasticadhaerens]